MVSETTRIPAVPQAYNSSGNGPPTNNRRRRALSGAGRKRKATSSLPRRRGQRRSTSPSLWLIKILYFLHLISLKWLILAPLRMLYSWLLEYPSRAQAARTEKRYIDIMNSTEDLETWQAHASLLDRHRGMEEWQKTASERGHCHTSSLLNDTKCATSLAVSHNERAIGEFLRSQLHRNAHGMTCPKNFRYYTGTKHSIDSYNKAVVSLIKTFGGSCPVSIVSMSSRPSFGDNASESDCVTPRRTQNTTTSESEGTSEMDRPNPSPLGSPSGNVAYLPPAPLQSKFLSSLVQWAYLQQDKKWTLLTDVEKLQVLRDTLRSYGRSALMLSGGSTLGVYHTGVVRGLFNAGLLPDIISGSSAGSIVAAIICTKTNEELRTMLLDSILTVETLQLAPFTEEGFFQKLRRLMHTGAFMDVRILMENLRFNVGDLTFLEAYRKTGRILNVCVTSDQYSGTHMDRHFLLNYLTTPNVVVWSAVSASCALPGLFSSVQLIEKAPDGTYLRYLPGQLWSDGSVARDLPRESLATLFNVNYFIVSQVNPHIIPFLRKPLSPLVYKENNSRKILSSMWYSCCRELAHWILKLFDVGVLSKSGVCEVPYMFLTQRYDGDIMILPIGNVLHAVPDYFNIVANPSHEYIAFVTSKAQLRTWPHLNQIRHCTMIERALLSEIRFLVEKIEAEEKNE